MDGRGSRGSCSTAPNRGAPWWWVAWWSYTSTTVQGLRICTSWKQRYGTRAGGWISGSGLTNQPGGTRYRSSTPKCCVGKCSVEVLRSAFLQHWRGVFWYCWVPPGGGPLEGVQGGI